jgi:hypothetical protein
LHSDVTEERENAITHKFSSYQSGLFSVISVDFFHCLVNWSWRPQWGVKWAWRTRSRKGIFAVACALWWGAYSLGRTKNGNGNTAGFLVIGLWTLNLFGAVLIAFDHYIADTFFWASAAMLLVLIFAASTMKPIKRAI